MMAFYTKIFFILSFVVAVGCSVVSSSTKSADVTDISSAPEVNAEPAAPKGSQTAVFAGGCFWGVDAVFKHVKGVTDVKSGYSGGDLKNPTYEQVSEGDTGHAESVQVTFDPTKVTYVQLLTVFFSVAHDPTQLNRQGPDSGTQYRSAIFYADEDQKKAALEYIDAISKSGALKKPVVTEVTPLKKFYPAEDYHQNYLANHPGETYIIVNDAPKVVDLKARFPDLYK
ncbi:MAG: peptide-methionine (S)-S-oxide reductase MsrA [Acidobacteriota bacterium]